MRINLTKIGDLLPQEQITEDNISWIGVVRRITHQNAFP